MKVTQVISVSLLMMLFSSAVFGGVNYRLEDFEAEGTKSGVGLVSIDGKTYARTSLSPDLNIGPVGVGLDINLHIPLSGGDVPSELSMVSLRSLSYDHNGVAGFKWGRLRDVTFGYGLLMDNYDSGSGGSTVFNTEKAGFLGYGTVKDVRVDAMYTASSISAVRASYPLKSYSLMGAPLTVGATYVTDADGLSETIEGLAISRNKQDGFGVDVGLPIGGEFLTVYTEYAKLTDKGTAGTVGIKGNFFNQMDYRLGAVSLGKGFIPGYFNSTYETTSTPAGLSKTVTGFLGAASAEFGGGYFKAGAQYEKYDDKNLVTAAVGWKQLNNTVGVINYTVPFSGNSSAVVKADVLYITGGVMDYVVHVKRTYVTSSTFSESYAVEMRFNMSKLFPSVPFF